MTVGASVPLARQSLARQALTQIKEKGYAEKYLRQGKKERKKVK